MYRILIDSCGELTKEMQRDGHFASIPLILQVDGQDIIDDDTFDQQDFLKRVAASPEGPHSACPSPDAYMQQMEGADRVYIVTLSAQLSGSYASACLGADLYREDHEDVQIHVFDSKSASVGETLIGLKIRECENAGMSFDEVIEFVDSYIASQHTFFVLESLDTLRKAGRLTGVKAVLARTLNIKPVMGSTDEGSITQLGQARGMTRALDKMAGAMLSVTDHTEHKTLAISHCNCPERAKQLARDITRRAHFNKVIILDTRGVSTMYANDGGVILVV